MRARRSRNSFTIARWAFCGSVDPRRRQRHRTRGAAGRAGVRAAAGRAASAAARRAGPRAAAAPRTAAPQPQTGRRARTDRERAAARAPRRSDQGAPGRGPGHLVRRRRQGELHRDRPSPDASIWAAAIRSTPRSPPRRGTPPSNCCAAVLEREGWRAYAPKAGVFVEPDALDLFGLSDDVAADEPTLTARTSPPTSGPLSAGRC